MSPTTEISADSLSASCQTLPSPGMAKRSAWGTMIRRNSRRRGMPTERAASSSPRAIAWYAPRKISLWYAPEMIADRDRPGGERIDADEALGAQHVRERGQRLAAAEVEQVDHQQVRECRAAPSCRRRRASRSGPVALDPRPRDQRAEHAAERERGRRNRDRHQRRLQHQQAPAAGAEAHQLGVVDHAAALVGPARAIGARSRAAERMRWAALSAPA